jgi:hypothetical protein
MNRAWHSLTREQQRMVVMTGFGLLATLLIYLIISGIVALAFAAVLAYSLGRHRSTRRPEPPEPAPEPVTRVEPPPRPSPQRRVRPGAQTPLGRLFAERPAWSGPPVGPFEPSRRQPTGEQDPYDSA